MNTTGRYDNEFRDYDSVGATSTSDTAPSNIAPNTKNMTVAAVFSDRDAAHDAIHELHDEGFRDTWIGIARRDDVGGYTERATNKPLTPDEPLTPNDYGASRNATAPEDYRAPNDNVSRPLANAEIGSMTDAPAIDDSSIPAGALAAGGTTDSTRVESDNWFMRFFGEGDESLHDALVRHGVNEADANTAGSLPAHSAIVTVEGANQPELAAQILSQAGGTLITRGLGSTGYGTSGVYPGAASGAATSGPIAASGTVGATVASGAAALWHATPSTPDRGTRADENEDELERKYAPSEGTLSDPEFATSNYATDSSRPNASAPRSSDHDFTPAEGSAPDATAFDDYGSYRAGTPVDEGTRLQLREERLRVDKSRISRGGATIGTDVVTETHDMDVPRGREELFTERRRTSGDRTDAATPGAIGAAMRLSASRCPKRK